MEEPRNPQKGEIWYRHAHVETADWESLPKNATLRVMITDAQGSWQSKAWPTTKELFLKYFFVVGDALWEQRALVQEVSQDQGTCWVTYLNKEGNPMQAKEESKPFNLKRFCIDFQKEQN